MKKKIKVKCPHCDIVFYYHESEFRPFCSERCKMIDLGHWFKESYKVPVADKVNEVEEDNEENIEEEDGQKDDENIDY